MADFTGNRLLPDEVHRRLGHQTASQLQPPPSGGTATGMESQPSLHRRHSYQATFAAPQSAPSATPRQLSTMDFGASEDTATPLQFAQSSIPPDSVNAAMSLPVTTLDTPGSILRMPPLPNDTMVSMVPGSLGTMSVDPMIPNSTDLGMFESPSFDGSFGQATMGASGPGFNMGMVVEDDPMPGHPSHQGPIGTQDEGMGMLAFSSAVSSTDDIPSAPSFPFPQNPSGTGQSNANGDSLGATSHDLAAADMVSLQNLSFRLPLEKPVQGPATQTNIAAPHTVVGPPPVPHMGGKSIYTKSGFDAMRALQKVANRKDPVVNVGAVDMSCAFVVCDVTLDDCPIIYASDSFQNLTGYNQHEIVGRNCRFLQAPEGNVEAGVKRKFVDDASVFRFKQAITTRHEAQECLVNYRKGGKPFVNLLTVIPISWDTDEIRYIIGFQTDLVEYPGALSSNHEAGGVKVDYKNVDLSHHIWEPPVLRQSGAESGQTLGAGDISTQLHQFLSKSTVASDWHKQSWHKMLLENADDVIHVISLKGTFQYVSPSCKRVLEYDPAELAGSSLSSVCHPCDVVSVMRELKDANGDAPVNIVFRMLRKHSGFVWFESHGSLFSEHGKGRKCIILLGRSRPFFSLGRQMLSNHGGEIGDNELWTKLSTSGMFLFVSSNVRSLLDLQPEALVGTSIHDLMRKESRVGFGHTLEKARRGDVVSCKHEVHNRRGQVLLAQTFLYPGEDGESKPSFLLAQIKLLKASSRSSAGSQKNMHSAQYPGELGSGPLKSISNNRASGGPGSWSLSTPTRGLQDHVFAELGTTKCSSWQFELRQMEKVNRMLTEELNMLLSNKKKRKRRKGSGNIIRECVNCHTRNTPEWRRGPSGQRDLCNSCGLRYAKQVGRVSPRNSSRGGSGGNGESLGRLSLSSAQSSPKLPELASDASGDGERNLGGDSNGDDTRPSSATTVSPTQPAQAFPPSSQPLLGAGCVIEMPPIREE